MSEQFENLLVGMADAGCTETEIKGAEQIIRSGRLDELKKHLKKCRSNLLDEMHESQKRVDRMDYLIRQTEKNNKIKERMTKL